MTCSCLNGSRRLEITLPECDSRTERELASLDYWCHESSRTWSVEVGGKSAFQSPTDVVNFLEVFVGTDIGLAARARWCSGMAQGCCGNRGENSPETPAEECFFNLGEMAARTSSPLLEILRNKRIRSHFQPVFQRDGETIWGYECLMRAENADGQSISPAQLLAWAKAESLLSMLDRVCRETHLRNAAAKLPRDLSILINFIPTAIYEPAFCLRSTMQVVQEVGLEPQSVIFEVVETEQVQNQTHLAKILDHYRQAGFRTALDDIGAGFSGLTMLANLRPDLLKLDRELVQGAANNFTHMVVVKGLIQIAHDCGQQVLAEGIETESQFRQMLEVGVDLFQGFFLGRPSPEPLVREAVS